MQVKVFQYDEDVLTLMIDTDTKSRVYRAVMDSLTDADSVIYFDIDYDKMSEHRKGGLVEISEDDLTECERVILEKMTDPCASIDDGSAETK